MTVSRLCLCRHHSERFTCISSLKGNAALGSRCPSHPLSAGNCQGQAAAEGWGQTRPRARRPTACALRPPRRRRDPGNPRLQPREDGRGKGARGAGCPGHPQRAEAQFLAGTFWNSPAQPGAGKAQIRPRPHPEERGRLRRSLAPTSRGRGARARTRPHCLAHAHTRAHARPPPRMRRRHGKFQLVREP